MGPLYIVAWSAKTPKSCLSVWAVRLPQTNSYRRGARPARTYRIYLGPTCISRCNGYIQIQRTYPDPNGYIQIQRVYPDPMGISRSNVQCTCSLSLGVPICHLGLWTHAAAGMHLSIRLTPLAWGALYYYKLTLNAGSKNRCTLNPMNNAMVVMLHRRI